MRKNCNLELRLVPPSVSLQSSDFDDHHRQPQPMMDFLGESPNQQQQQQQLTIFYNGNISVCDVTELQARNIIWLASREMEEKSNTPSGSQPSSPFLQSPVYSPTGLSMKKSLERFLQKRKYRIQATSPYN